MLLDPLGNRAERNVAPSPSDPSQRIGFCNEGPCLGAHAQDALQAETDRQICRKIRVVLRPGVESSAVPSMLAMASSSGILDLNNEHFLCRTDEFCQTTIERPSNRAKYLKSS